MNERMLSDMDIVSVAQTATSIRRQDGNDTFLIDGISSWGERLSLSVAVRSSVVIVTIFFTR
jgi:hypothetical protein